LEHIDVESRTSDPERFDSLVPWKLQLGLYAVFFLNAVQQYVFSQGIDHVLQVGGFPELFAVLVILPLGYGVIISEFLSTYAGILLFFPRKIRKTDFKINFLDPEGLGGLRPVGELMKSAYYFLMVGLIAAAVMLYAPSIIDSLSGSQYGAVGPVQEVLFTAAWILAIGLMGYGLAQIHWFMKRTKRKELTRLDKKAREIVDKPFEMKEFEISDREKYDEIRMRMDYINSTREYPTTFTMWVQLSIGVILPKAVQLLLSSL
jgi:type III secretory pathway component EscU